MVYCTHDVGAREGGVGEGGGEIEGDMEGHSINLSVIVLDFSTSGTDGFERSLQAQAPLQIPRPSSSSSSHSIPTSCSITNPNSKPETEFNFFTSDSPNPLPRIIPPVSSSSTHAQSRASLRLQGRLGTLARRREFVRHDAEARRPEEVGGKVGENVKGDIGRGRAEGYNSKQRKRTSWKTRMTIMGREKRGGMEKKTHLKPLFNHPLH